MSWKLSSKLKETHLSPPPITLSPTQSAAPVPTNPVEDEKTSIATASSTNDNDVGSCPLPTRPEDRLITVLPQDPFVAIVNQSPTDLKSGILIVTLHEGLDFSLPEQYQHVLQQYDRSRYPAKYLPYALLDLDKAQVFVNAISGSPGNPIWAGENAQYRFDVSWATVLVVHLYLRNPNGSGRSHDIFLGTIRVYPRFEGNAATDSANQERLYKSSTPEWIAVQHGSGKIKVGVVYIENRYRVPKVEDFELLKVIGNGSFGKIIQAKKKDTARIYAIKTIRKTSIKSGAEIIDSLTERSALSQNNNFVVPIKFSFQSAEKLYLVSVYVHGGELFHHLQKELRFDINRSRFYTTELLCAFEWLHSFDFIYRDLKPENILLDYSGHIALCDFGFYKLDIKDKGGTDSFTGTPEYLAPELLLGKGYTATVDWWTLGILLFEMLTGLPPFYDENTNTMYRQILEEPIHFPSRDIVPPSAIDLITRLLDRKPEQRLGAQGGSEIKAHPFFHSIDWRKVYQRLYEPPFKPNMTDTLDPAGFDHEFTAQASADSYANSDWLLLPLTMEQQCAGWSYNRPVGSIGDTGDSVKGPSFVGGLQGGK